MCNRANGQVHVKPFFESFVHILSYVEQRFHTIHNNSSVKTKLILVSYLKTDAENIKDWIW